MEHQTPSSRGYPVSWSHDHIPKLREYVATLSNPVKEGKEWGHMLLVTGRDENNKAISYEGVVNYLEDMLQGPQFEDIVGRHGELGAKWLPYFGAALEEVRYFGDEESLRYIEMLRAGVDEIGSARIMR